MKILVLFLFLPWKIFAAVDIAFIEVKDKDGKIVQLESNGHYAHIAISYEGQWLHAYPPNGVETITQAQLEKIGRIKIILTLPEVESLSESQVKKYLGKPYDWSFSWGDESIYCAELIGKLLDIKPLAMSFDSRFWPPIYRKIKGFGLSPDDIFQAIRDKGFFDPGPIGQCKAVFKK